MSGIEVTDEVKTGAPWLEGLGERQKVLNELFARKTDDETVLEELARILICYRPIEKPWSFLALEPFLTPSAFWKAFHRHWTSFDQPPHGRYLWILGRRRLDWRIDYMSPQDAAAFVSLPDMLRICKRRDDETRVALSWRLSEAEGATSPREHDRSIIEARSPKAEVAGIYARENEATSEVVLFSNKAIIRTR